jgi:GH24 family phage-related lysozyme (muramidase)
MKSRCLTALVAVLFVAPIVGCGGHSGSSPSVVSQPATTYLPPESARVPEGAKPEAPPVSLPPAISAKHIDAKGLHLIEGFEGWSSCPYWDPYGRVWTRGYGETEGIGSGSACISRARGEANLKRLVESRYEWALRGLSVSLNQNQWDALCSFLWNVGAGIFQGTTVGADLRGRRFGAAANAMLAYVHAGGQVLPGLVSRRRAEVRLFLTPVSHPARDRTAEHRRLLALYAERLRTRRHLVHAGCRVQHPRKACRPLFHHGHDVNHEIRRLHARGIY